VPLKREDTIKALKFRKSALTEERKRLTESDSEFDSFIQELVAQAKASDATFIETGKSEVDLKESVIFFYHQANDKEIADLDTLN